MLIGNGTLPGASAPSRFHVHGNYLFSNRPVDAIGSVEINSDRDSAGHVYLNRTQVRETIETLQKILDEAGPEPFRVEDVTVGASILATDAEKLPLGSCVSLNGRDSTYTVVEPDQGGNALSFWPHGDGCRMAGKAGVYVIVERVGPEPIVAPECDYFTDRDGDYWVPSAVEEGNWVMSSDLDSARRFARAESGRTFESLLGTYGPLILHREVTSIETLPVIEKAA